jgi:hypothetical protein
MKHGAVWVEADEPAGAELVGEYYDPKVDLIGAVYTRDGNYLALVYGKVQPRGSSTPPQWTARGPQNWFPTLEDATNYMIESVRAARDDDDGKRRNKS